MQLTALLLYLDCFIRVIALTSLFEYLTFCALYLHLPSSWKPQKLPIEPPCLHEPLGYVLC